MEYQLTNRVFTNIEKGFNIANSVPIVSVFTSPLRAKLGAIQAVVAGALGLGVTIAIGIETLKSQPNQDRIRKFGRLQEYAFHHMFHGLLNMIRGVGETIVAVPTMGILNAFTFLPLNLMQTPEFSPIKGYKAPAPAAVHA